MYIHLSLRNERILIFRMIVSPHRPGGGFRDVQHVGTRQFSVLLARILGANVPPQFIARWNGSISVESHSNCMQMGRHMLKQAKTRERKCWLTGRKAKCLLLYCVCVCVCMKKMYRICQHLQVCFCVASKHLGVCLRVCYHSCVLICECICVCLCGHSPLRG